MTTMRAVKLGPRGDRIEKFPDGSMIIRSPQALQPYAVRYTERLERWAKQTPEAVFLAQRAPDGGWQTLSYGETWERVQGIAQALLDRGLSPQRPLAILSGNDIDHALMALGAMHVGIPYAPISVPFSLASKDHAKLHHVFDLLTPGMVFASDGALFEAAVKAVADDALEYVVGQRPPQDRSHTPLSELVATRVTPAVADAAQAVKGETIAKFLFTSGSSSLPKAVINTHRMLCSNQQMIVQTLPFLGEAPPIVVDWLPWNHTAGGNCVFGLVLFNGGTLYIDEGKPMPGQFEKTVRNVSEVRPTAYIGVPRAYEMLVAELRKNPSARDAFFSRLQMMIYAAAGLANSIWQGLEDMAVSACGHKVLTLTTLGATETSPVSLIANWDAGQVGVMGLPAPGVELKLIPNRGRLELRIRGPHVTPGYWRQPEQTAQAFDEQGWYCMGDAVRFVDEARPGEGLFFDGRIAENFKMDTGTWVNVGPLRTLVTNLLSPMVRDVAITGHDRSELGVLVFPALEACRALSGLPASASVREVLESAPVTSFFQERLEQICEQGASVTDRVCRLALLVEPPSTLEFTDKETVSYHVVLKNRAAEIESMYRANGESPLLLVARRALKPKS